VLGTWDKESPALVVAPAVSADGITLTHNVVDQGIEGIRLFGTISNLTGTQNTIRNCRVGIRVETAYPSAFTNVVFRGTTMVNVPFPTYLAGKPGISVIP
jgi:hypothetical protein